MCKMPHLMEAFCVGNVVRVVRVGIGFWPFAVRF